MEHVVHIYAILIKKTEIIMDMIEIKITENPIIIEYVNVLEENTV